MATQIYVRSPKYTPGEGKKALVVDVQSSTCTDFPFKLRVTGDYTWDTLIAIDMGDAELEALKEEVDTALETRRQMKIAALEELQEALGIAVAALDEIPVEEF
jgi:hypothetical protein